MARFKVKFRTRPQTAFALEPDWSLSSEENKVIANAWNPFLIFVWHLQTFMLFHTIFLFHYVPPPTFLTGGKR